MTKKEKNRKSNNDRARKNREAANPELKAKREAKEKQRKKVKQIYASVCVRVTGEKDESIMFVTDLTDESELARNDLMDALDYITRKGITETKNIEALAHTARDYLTHSPSLTMAKNGMVKNLYCVRNGIEQNFDDMTNLNVILELKHEKVGTSTDGPMWVSRKELEDYTRDIEREGCVDVVAARMVA